jgi:hypothetical protein
MCRFSFSSLLSLLICMPGSFAAPQAVMPAPQANGAKVCVATVANASTAPAMLDRLTQRLVDSLKQNKVLGVVMDSATTMQSQLHPTIDNGEESKQKECDFILLTQIRAKPLSPAEGQPEISIGGRVPSIDASDPLGGHSGPVYRQNVEIRFALFRTDQFDPDVEAVLLERPTSSATDSFMGGMDREANRIGKEWKKKSRDSAGDAKFLGMR